ncbi:beta-1,3-galactosyltransferase 1-like [Mercenaria mercenaria]|uniref:beta-1,3-galactosyltransferase 1-like n=1 Tax=Mercenaria mercenaria TaxID=6596 RepID=UPI00234F8203|nr:beta-1,3-galactosyltransferase 1-like [Mercenaria mercenaria]XP_045214068.2 beta-1,3-galactosyltransferase 1-like [Mercenaria mercenaria]
MRRTIRLSVYITLVWTVCVVLFLVISFPEAFDEHKTSHGYSRSALVLRKRRPNITLPTRTGNSPSLAWLRNFHPKARNLTALEAEQLDTVDTNVDYVVTETGKVKVLVVNRTIKAAGKKPEKGKDTYNENLIQTLRLRREDNERRYYTPRKTKVNPIDHEFIINGAQICTTDAKYMTILVAVPSIPSHYFVRDAIRKTYGSYSKKSFLIEHTAIEVTVRLMFLVGKDGDINTDRIVRNESRVYGDIVLADFVESYRNLTRKMLIALKWVSIYCSDVDFLMKVDEDVFVNIPQLAKNLHRRPYGIKGSVYGYINVHSSVRRKGKWGISKDEFPLTNYPNYASGNSYVISGNIIPRMYMISEYLPYMPIEDAFITGCLARIVEAKVVSVPGFTYWFDPEPDPCQFVRDKRISATHVTTTVMEKLWKACNSYSETCVKYNFTK